LNQLLYFYETQYEGRANEDELETTVFNPLSFSRHKLAGDETSAVDVKLAPVNVGQWNFVC
jgi:hypothetical protein